MKPERRPPCCLGLAKKPIFREPKRPWRRSRADNWSATRAIDSDAFRQWLKERSIQPCIPPRSNRLRPVPYSKASYRKRHLVENFFEKLKRFRRIATRYDKLSITFFGFVCLATAVTFTK